MTVAQAGVLLACRALGGSRGWGAMYGRVRKDGTGSLAGTGDYACCADSGALQNDAWCHLVWSVDAVSETATACHYCSVAAAYVVLPVQCRVALMCACSCGPSGVCVWMCCACVGAVNGVQWHLQSAKHWCCIPTLTASMLACLHAGLPACLLRPLCD